MEKKLNLNIPENIAEFEALINKNLPKKLFYKLILRGRGLDFDGYRDYGPDEDASSIDWKASVRSNKLLAKQYIEERDLKIMVVIDVGDNMVFGMVVCRLRAGEVVGSARAMAGRLAGPPAIQHT